MIFCTLLTFSGLLLVFVCSIWSVGYREEQLFLRFSFVGGMMMSTLDTFFANDSTPA